MFATVFLQSSGMMGDLVDGLDNIIGMDLFEEEIDDVIFQTNEFLTNATMIGSQGPFWWILEMCMALGATFSIVMAGSMAYKMMVKGEGLDLAKFLKVFAISFVMFAWYPNSNLNGASICGMLSYIPNCIGSWTHDLYEAEALQVQSKLDGMAQLIQVRDSLAFAAQAANPSETGLAEVITNTSVGETVDPKTLTKEDVEARHLSLKSTYTGLMVMMDKIIMFLSLIIFRIGWWGTIYCQQILLGMLTIFGPLQWAFSLLPKWEGAWAKWLTRYLTVHFYGAMLYFVGFYVLLLFDIVLTIQEENLIAITNSQNEFNGYLQNSFMTAGYLLVASIVSLRCLNLVPDLAAWMIPEGDTAFSTRSFGEGVASGVKQGATGLISKLG